MAKKKRLTGEKKTQKNSPYLLCIFMQKKSVNILHLDGRRLHVECDPGKTRINQLMQVNQLCVAYFKEFEILQFSLLHRWWWTILESQPVMQFFLAYLLSKAVISYFLDLTTRSAVWRLTTINNYPIPALMFISDSDFMFTLFSLCSKSPMNSIYF